MLSLRLEMKGIFSTRKKALPDWQVGLCLLLIGLMLYNPFASLWAAGDGFCYDRLARNRATVGASELQHFSPVTNSNAQMELDVDVPSTDLMQLVREEHWSFNPQELFSPSAEIFTHLWSRPPPSL